MHNFLIMSAHGGRPLVTMLEILPRYTRQVRNSHLVGNLLCPCTSDIVSLF
jgi:hypothetical protein